MILDLAHGRKPRATPDGTWWHFNCPFCEDRSHHLGVLVGAGGWSLASCFRCGAGRGRKLTIVEKGATLPCTRRGAARVPGAYRAEKAAQNASKAVSEDSLPGEPLASIPEGSVRAELIRNLFNPAWNLSWGDLARAGMRVGSGPSLILPVYDPLAGGWGWQVRGSGKARFLSEGVTSGLLRKGTGGGVVVVVEGWADAAAIPAPFVPWVLGGVGGSLPGVHEGVVLALDSDAAGKRRERRILREWRGRRIEVVRYDAKDPAEAGKAMMAEALKNRQIGRIVSCR